MLKTLIYLAIRPICFALAFTFVSQIDLPAAAAQSVDEPAWQRLREQVQTRLDELTKTMATAKAQGIETDYANVSVQTIKAFQTAAQWDHTHVEEVRRLFKTFRFYAKTDPTEADQLAANEMNACLELADHALAQLRQQMAGEITLAPTPDFAQGDLSLGSGYYRLDDRIVFPYTIFWLPRVGSTMPDALGRIGEEYFALSSLKPDGSYEKSALHQRIKSAKEQSNGNFAPLYYFWGHLPAKWMQEQHPDAMLGGRRFTQYDIDNPLVRKWIGQLCQSFLPPVAEAYGEGPMLYLLANEPHFATAQGGWLVKNGQSKFTEEKYRQWLEAKYKTIDELNRAHESSHQNMDSVKMPFPIPKSTRGGPVWYDWCRFNMDRVNDWFAFLKQTTRTAVTDRQVPVTIKMLGHHLVDGQRDQGMDIEFLVNLQEVTGGDLRMQPHDATVYTHLEGGLDASTNWTSRYSYDWVSQAMFLDFVRSLAPEKPFFDSEWHGFGAVHWRHFELDRNYVRAALWHAFSNGMGMIEPWMWGRLPDGSMRNQADQIGELATQPIAVDAYGRTMKELNAFADVFAAAAVPTHRRFMVFYSEETAIQQESYADQLSTTYEALKLLNVSVGLTTPTHLKTLDPQDQIVIVPPTAFISNASLQTLREFQDEGGKIVLFGEELSFQKTEMGDNREGESGLSSVASVPFQQPYELANELETALAEYSRKHPVEVAVTDDQGKKAYGVFVQQAVRPVSGQLYVILNNASQDARQVTFNLSESSSSLLDSITQQPAELSFKMKPYDVRLIQVER